MSLAGARGGAELPRLMLVTDRRRTRGRDLVACIAAAVAGGVGIVQLREKDLPDDELRALVQQVRRAVPGATRITVNDRPRVAATQRVGLHLPAAAAPLPLEPARRRKRFPVYGRSVHDESEALRAVEEQADYVLLGTIYASESKPGRAGAGPELVRSVARRVAPLPLFAIGGIVASRIPELIHAGAHGVAVCGAVLAANDPRRVAQALALALAVAGGPRAGS